jgi:hypothetical protein
LVLQSWLSKGGLSNGVWVDGVFSNNRPLNALPTYIHCVWTWKVSYDHLWVN